MPLLQDRLRQYNFLRNWSPEEHKCYPARLKQAAKLLLLAAARNSGSASPRDTGDAFNSLQWLLYSHCITEQLSMHLQHWECGYLMPCDCGYAARHFGTKGLDLGCFGQILGGFTCVMHLHRCKCIGGDLVSCRCVPLRLDAMFSHFLHGDVIAVGNIPCSMKNYHRTDKRRLRYVGLNLHRTGCMAWALRHRWVVAASAAHLITR